MLEIATRNLAGTNNVSLLQADARAIPLADGEVDVAHASLLMHHFDPDDAIAALAEMRRVVAAAESSSTTCAAARSPSR